MHLLVSQYFPMGIAAAIFLFGSMFSHAGPPTPSPPAILHADTLPEGLIDTTRNVIKNAGALAPFFQRLRWLESDSLRRVRIVHIGDSHIQAGLLTGPLRGMLQDRFGNAGRGLVFPFPLARTNCPLDLDFYSSQNWESRKSAFRKGGPPLGICGISIRTAAPRASLQLFLKDRYHYGHDYSFDRITLFHGASCSFGPVSADAEEAATPYFHNTKAGDTLYDLARRYGVSVSDLQHWNNLPNSRIGIGQRLIVAYEGKNIYAPEEPPLPEGITKKEFNAYQTQYLLPHPTRQLTLAGNATDGSSSTLFGMLLEKADNPGILYNAIGVNGVTYYHYNHSELFWEQLPALQPDLVIVSLGTNEALAPRFQRTAFEEEISRFMDHLAKVIPSGSIVLTTNPDVLRKKRYDNPNNLEVREAILQTAKHKELAVWDLHEIMGGTGSVRKWRERQLAHTDFIHFTKEGYRLQAELLYRALIKAYDAGN